MKTVKVLKNITVTLANYHENIHVGQSIKAYYTNVNKDVTIIKVHKQIEKDVHYRKYLIDAIEQTHK